MVVYFREKNNDIFCFISFFLPRGDIRRGKEETRHPSHVVSIKLVYQKSLDSQPETCSGDSEEETLSSSNGSTEQGTLSPSDSVQPYEYVCKCGCVDCQCHMFDKDDNRVY